MSWLLHRFRRLFWLLGTGHTEASEPSAAAPVPQLGEGAGYSASTIANAAVLVRSNTAIRRMVDSVHIEGTTVYRETSYDVVLDRSVLGPSDRLVVPLAGGSRGRLWDSQDATCDGRSVSILAHAENQVFARAVIADALRRAYNVPWTDIPRRVRNAAFGIAGAPPDEARAGLHVLRSSLASLLADERRNDAENLIRLAQFFAWNYVVFAELPPDVPDRFVVKRRVAAPFDVRRLGALRRLRAAAGLRPVSLTVPLYGGPFRAASYHLRVRAPEGYHVHRRQLISRDEDSEEWRVEAEGDQGPLWSPTGGDYAHLYLAHSRGQRTMSKRRALVAKVNFAEDQPGSLIGAFAPAAMLLALVLIGQLVSDHVFPPVLAGDDPNGLDQANSSFAAMLLAIPGIAAVWFRPRRQNELVRSPLVSVMAPFVNGALSFAAAVVYLGFRLAPCVDPGSGVLTECNPGRRSNIWLALTLVIATWAALLGYRVFAKHTAEEPRCDAALPTRAWRRLRKGNGGPTALPRCPRGWVGRFVYGLRIADTADTAHLPLLDRYYERLRPPFSRGDVYLTRSDSFEFPFAGVAPHIDEADADRARWLIAQCLEAGDLDPVTVVQERPLVVVVETTVRLPEEADSHSADAAAPGP
jgi:hypothetical protein